MGKDGEAFELSLNRDGKPCQTTGNCVVALANDEKTKNMFRYNLMLTKTELQAAWWERTSDSISDNDINNIRLYLEQRYGLVSEKGIPRAIDIIAHQNTYHPIRDYLNNLKWDGTKRIEYIFPRYLGVTHSEYTTEATKLFMIGAIARVFQPGIKFDTMICVADAKQGGGKSTLARFFAIKDEWFTDDLKNLDDENVYRKIQGHWIIEFSEMLATANAKTVESLKAFMSRQKDSYKIPYEKYPQDFPRQCVFFGTTNNLNFLPNDKTGNRRFIPILADCAKAEKHPLDNETETRQYIIDAWAEAMEYYRSGNYKLTFSKDMQNQVEMERKAFEAEDPKVGVIQEWLNNCNHKSVCSLMIYHEAFDSLNHPQNWELREINDIMNYKITGWEKHPTSDSKVRFPKYGKQRAWDLVPEPKVPSNDFIPLSDDAGQENFPF